MSHIRVRLAAILLALALTAVANSSSFAQGSGGNDQIVAWLRHDDPAVMNAQNYSSYIQPSSPLPSTTFSTAATYGYLGAWIGSGYQYFLQIGFMEAVNGVRWFTYSTQAGMQCYGPGWHSYWSGKGCLSDPNVMGLTLDTFQLVQMDTDLNGTWHVFVYNPQGQGYDVARIYLGTNTAYWVHVSSEEGYNVSPDPVIPLRYYHYHPMYYRYPSGWTDWPASGSTTNYLACQAGIPDIYKAVVNVNGDSRAWFAGTGGNTCYVNPLF